MGPAAATGGRLLAAAGAAAGDFWPAGAAGAVAGAGASTLGGVTMQGPTLAPAGAVVVPAAGIR
jgi:hypothetical protein